MPALIVSKAVARNLTAGHTDSNPEASVREDPGHWDHCGAGHARGVGACRRCVGETGLWPPTRAGSALAVTRAAQSGTWFAVRTGGGPGLPRALRLLQL